MVYPGSTPSGWCPLERGGALRAIVLSGRPTDPRDPPCYKFLSFEHKHTNMPSFLLVLALIAAFSATTANEPPIAGDVSSWEMPRCRNMWTSVPSPVLVTREQFSMPRSLDSRNAAAISISSNVASLLSKPVPWPPRDRGSVQEFFSRMGQNKTSLEPFQLRNPTLVQAKVNHLRRCIYIKNLKVIPSMVRV